MNRYAKPENFASRIRTPLLREHFVYRTYGSQGELLYIGCSVDPVKRIGEHKATSRWAAIAVRYTLSGPYNYETARLVEYEAIESERSIYNYSSERRELRKIRDRLIERHVAKYLAEGLEVSPAVRRACALADLLFRDHTHEALTDLAVPEARRVDAEDARKVAA